MGGGINNTGQLAIFNTTVSGNMSGSGGGISNSNHLTVLNSTITGNYSESVGGGIDNFCRWSPQVTMTLKGSIVSGNNQVESYGYSTITEISEISVGDSQPDCSTSQVVLNGFNIIGSVRNCV